MIHPAGLRSANNGGLSGNPAAFMSAARGPKQCSEICTLGTRAPRSTVFTSIEPGFKAPPDGATPGPARDLSTPPKCE
jgi:hypothetical protein